jgi:hypothetical protein
MVDMDVISGFQRRLSKSASFKSLRHFFEQQLAAKRLGKSVRFSLAYKNVLPKLRKFLAWCYE